MPACELKLIVGLGNPGSQYERTRHNAGFWFVEQLARRHGGTFRREARFQAQLARAQIGTHELWLVMPQTFMNRSGQALAGIAGFYRLTPAQILVVHDDIDLLPGIARLKLGGGHGGHNGLRDIIAQIGADFWRLRLGVGHPGHRDEVIDAVLAPPTAAEAALIDAALQRGLDAVPQLLESGPQPAMHALHSANSRDI